MVVGSLLLKDANSVVCSSAFHQCMLRRTAGPGFFHEARERQKRASLVETGRHAGRSRVNFGGFRGVTLNYHAWKRGACLSTVMVTGLWGSAVRLGACIFFK